MDAFGTVRALARRKHEQLTASLTAGKPVTAIDLLAAAARDTGLNVLYVPRAYPLLAEGDGALLREAGDILVAEDLDEQMRSFVLAHEFGHYWIESPADPILVSRGMDPGTPEIASPLGIRRVEGYSARSCANDMPMSSRASFFFPIHLPGSVS